MRPGRVRLPVTVLAALLLWAADLSPRGLGSTAAGPIPDTEIPTEGAAAAAELASADEGFSTFWVRRIPRTDFPRAGYGLRPGHSGASGPAALAMPSPPAAPPGRRPPWESASLSVRAVSARSGSVSRYEGRYLLQATRRAAWGRLLVDGDVGDVRNSRYLARATLEAETTYGSLLTIGDGTLPAADPALAGAGIRGVTAAGPRARDGERKRLRGALAYGGLPVRYSGVVSGDRPRRLLAGSLEVSEIHGGRLWGQAFRVTDPIEADLPAAEHLYGGMGAGAGWEIKSRSASTRGWALVTDYRFRDGGRADGAGLGASGSAAAGPLSVTGQARATRGIAYTIGSFGALQPVPRRSVSLDASVRLPRELGLAAGLGSWRQPPDRAWSPSLGWVPELDPQGEAVVAYRAESGSHRAGRVSWKRRAWGTGLDLSFESRRRTATAGTHGVDTWAMSWSQRIGAAAHATLRLHSSRPDDSSARSFVTGSLSTQIAGANLLVQQQTFWQEPFGSRIVTLAEISSISLLSRRLQVAAALAQSHAGDGGRYRAEQTQFQGSGDLRLGGGLQLSTRLRLVRSSGGEVRTVELGIRHAPDLPGSLPATPHVPRELLRHCVQGRVFEDRNGDGVRQPDEPGVAGIALIVDSAPQDPVYTDADGIYRTWLLAGPHTLRIVPETVAVAYSLEGVAPVEVLAGEFATAPDIGLLRRVGEVRGRVVRPEPGPAESGVAGVRIVLNGRDFTFTDGAGGFSFGPLPAGVYRLGLDEASLPFGTRCDGSAECVVEVPPEGGSAVCDFTVRRPVRQVRF